MKTKNLFLAGALVIAAFSTVQGQEKNLGVKAGVNYTNLTSQMEPDPVFGFHVGLTSEFKIAPDFTLQPELLYSMEGARSEISYSEEEFTFSSDQKIKLGYINLPLMAKYYVRPGFSFQAGPQLGYLVSAKNEFEVYSNFSEDFMMDESGTVDIKDELTKFSFGLNFGLGYEFYNNLFLQARYHIGLTDISNFGEEMEDLEGELDELKNKGFQVSVGYKF